jgi:hypothetical protein
MKYHLICWGDAHIDIGSLLTAGAEEVVDKKVAR